MNMGKEDECE